MKRSSLLLLVLPFFIQLINCKEASQNLISKTLNNVADIEIITLHKDQNGDPTIDELQKNIVFSPSGLTCYFKHIYNCHKYTQEALPALPFKHFEEFLRHGINTKQTRTYTKAVFRLFDKKFKAVPYINADELIPFLQKLPDLLEKDLEPDQNRKFFVKRLIHFELEHNFEKLKQDPELFIDNLAEKIVESDFTIGNEINRNQLRFSITKLIDTCLGKIMWSPTDKDIWTNFMNIGKELNNLKEKGIISDSDDLDDCQWTLTTRFCFFLSLAGSTLSFEFYNQACEELTKGVQHLDIIPEQEELILSKAAQIKDTIVQNYATRENENINYYQRQKLIN
ncbi:TPA: hypothetical protein DIC20_01260 [Candidatus Dependentiae bacterium]|nr:MAG: hypothetical protein US03_C0002G0140 [candidate division TM6 bacterium GW2011_GWF2_36_131]KKQ03573.1 MAG: hypothetical protein US13_C0002G0139 [candidate division TM6 bacterium GW2011_GWE2_36_25]KKQ20151.1 MAG: hypothetical protein US32_C0001G0048 [candidate division TM6 bacterium GW2011_GWA2_36_9]HBR70693.1 hypothetical protein [Candidatus Dependentiae bacterium]HCU00313.1 hypothetical protein [Candidatus Dependentiae bacterium]